MSRLAVIGFVVLTVLVGCGVDGEPVPPTRDATGLTMGPVQPE